MNQSLSPYQLWQIEMYGDCLEQKTPEEEPENNFRERERNDAWVDDQEYFSMTEQAF